MRWILALIPFATLAGCVSTRVAEKESATRELLAFMSGAFSSQEQSAADPKNYFDIRLHMTPMWDAEHPQWAGCLYVEQATASSMAKPYRQRIYRVKAVGGGFASEVFTLPGEPLMYAGAWKDAVKLQALRALGPERMVPRTGCTVNLRRVEGGAYIGGTNGKDCPSERSGAVYATSEVMVYSDRIVSWDRGFDAAGTQVWGAEKGGYVFRRVNE